MVSLGSHRDFHIVCSGVTIVSNFNEGKVCLDGYVKRRSYIECGPSSVERGSNDPGGYNDAYEWDDKALVF